MLLLNEFQRGNGGDDLRAVNIDTGAVRLVAPRAMLNTGHVIAQFGAILADADPKRDTVYLADYVNFRILALSGISGL